jgi:hypothetical protein
VRETAIVTIGGELMKARYAASVLGVLAAFLTGAVTAAPVQYDFEADTQQWTCAQEGSLVGVARTPADVKSGLGSLEWSYAPGGQNATLERQDPGLPAGANSLHFWLRSSATTCFQILFREGDGSYYLLKTRAPAGQWQHYRVALSDLMLGEGGPGDGQFDPGNVVRISVEDITRLNVDDQADLTPRTVLLDGFTLSEDIVPARRATRTADGKQELLLDDFDRDTVEWLGRVRPQLTARKVDGRSVLHAKYQQGRTATNRFRLTDHMDPRYAGTKAVKVVARSSTATTLSVQFLERPRGAGAIYRSNVELPAGKEWQTVVVPLSAFQVSPAAPDTNGKLDLEECYLFQVMDVTPVAGARDVELEIDTLAALLME